MAIVGLMEVARWLGIESKSPKRPGNRLWELIRAKKIDIPYQRIGRRYFFNMQEVEEWWRARAPQYRTEFFRRR